ncbi:hypothetical protein [Thermomonospora cellulosilytica]|uniref:Phage-related protein n=1 Tax=Thermomonospora cellulosilytica TaxID=1411118 RepID=A0A7W3N1R5_9ACTN|nr:hypothetical protein [Thermomonospora cellulosilytica]MBA9005913.1 phage-related protein [Thermomonospora cellulosilytica]
MANTLGEAAVEIIAETGEFDDDLRRRLQEAIDDAVDEIGDDLDRIARQAEDTGRRLADAIGDGADDASQQVERLAEVARAADAAFDSLDPEELRRVAEEAARSRAEMADLARAARDADGAFSSFDPEELARIAREAREAAWDMERLEQQARRAASEIARFSDGDEVRRLAEEMQRAQREAERLSRTRLQQIQHEARQAGRAIWFAFRGASEDARRALDRIDNTRFREIVRRATEAGERIRRAFRNVDTDRLGRNLAGLARIFLGLAGAAAAVGGLGAALAGLTAVAAGLIGVLAPTVEILAGLPAAVLLAGAAFGTLRLALLGVGEAFSTALTGSAEEFEKTLENLSPAAQRVAREVRALQPEFERLRNTVQDAFFQQLEGDITAVARNLGGPLRQGMAGTAAEFGRLADAALQFGRSSEAVRLVDRVFGTLRRNLAQVRSDSIENLLGALSRFTRATLPAFNGIGSAINGALGRLTGFLDRAAASGDALRWVREGAAAVRQLGALFADLGRIVIGVVRAIQSASGSALGSISALADRLANFANSARGQAQLVEVFRAVNAIASQTGPVIEALIGGLATLGPTVAALARQIGPTLTAAIEGIVPALQGLGIGLVDVLVGVRLAVERLASSGALGALGRAFGELLSAVSPLLPALANVLVSALQSVAVAAQLLAPVLSVVAQGLAALADSPLGTALGPLVAALVAARIATGAWGAALTALMPALRFASRDAASLGRTLVTSLARHPIAAIVLAVAAAFGVLASQSETVRNFLGRLRDTIADLFGRLRAFGTSLVQTFRTEGAVAALRQLGSGIANFAAEAIPVAARALAGLAAAVLSGLARIAVGIPAAIADLAPRIISGLTSAFTRAVAALPGLISSFISALRSGLARLADVGQQIGQGLREAFTQVVASLRTEGPRIAAGIRDLLRAAFQFATRDLPAIGQEIGRAMNLALRALLPMVAQGIRSAGDAVVTHLPGLAQRIADGLSSLIRRAGEVLPQVINEMAAQLGQGVDRAAGQAATGARTGPGGQQLRQSLVDLLLDVAVAFAQQIPRLLPVIGQAIATIGAAVIQAGAAAAPGILAAVGRLLLALAQALITQMFQWGVQAILALSRGILSMLGGLVSLVASIPVRFAAALAPLAARMWSIATGAMSRMGAAISAGVSRAVSFAAQLPGRAAAAIASLPGRLGSLATSAMARMGAAFSSGVSRAASVVRGLPGRITGTLAGLGSALYSLGVQAMQGFISGVQSMAGRMVAAATAPIRNAINAARSLLRIGSPSKVFRDIGKFVGQGFVQGLTGEQSKIESTINALVKKIQTAFAGRRTRLDDQLIARLRGANRRLQTLAAERSRITDLIKAANERAAEVTRQASDFASLSGVLSSLGSSVPRTAEALATALRNRLALLKEFQSDVAALARRGLSRDLLDQIIAAGPEQGAALADALLSGPDSVIRDLNRTSKEIATTAQSLGRQSADLLFDSGRRAGAGFLEGLKAQQKDIEKLMRQIAEQVAATVKRTLKIKSPSRVMAGLGEDTLAGYLRGLDRLAPQITRSLEQALALPQLQVPAPDIDRLPVRSRQALEALQPAAASRATGGGQGGDRRSRPVRQVEVHAPVTVHMPTADPDAVGGAVSRRIAAAVAR